jgi:hypothetical protein
MTTLKLHVHIPDAFYKSLSLDSLTAEAKRDIPCSIHVHDTLAKQTLTVVLQIRKWQLKSASNMQNTKVIHFFEQCQVV